jgi:hypothetical protein
MRVRLGRARHGRSLMLGLIISVLLVGLIAGAIARLLIPGPQEIGILAPIIVGVIGSRLGYPIFHKDSQDASSNRPGSSARSSAPSHRPARLHPPRPTPHSAPLTTLMCRCTISDQEATDDEYRAVDIRWARSRTSHCGRPRIEAAGAEKRA